MNGKIDFTYNYAFGEYEKRGDWVSQFALDSAFTKAVVNQDIHVVKQLKSELRIYTNQVIGTAYNEKNGRVTNVPENYELWTGEFVQGAIVVGTGEWVHPVNGEFTGLCAGQHGIRAGESVDYTNNTFYLASDFSYVTIGRGVWKVSVDKAASTHVIYAGELTQSAEPGGVVYIYVKPEKGYEVSEFAVDNPSYVSGGIRYDEEGGFLIIDGVTGNITVTVKATEVKEKQADTTKPETDEETVKRTEEVSKAVPGKINVELSVEEKVDVESDGVFKEEKDNPKEEKISIEEEKAVKEEKEVKEETISIGEEKVPKAGMINSASGVNESLDKKQGINLYIWIILALFASVLGISIGWKRKMTKKNE